MIDSRDGEDLVLVGVVVVVLLIVKAVDNLDKKDTKILLLFFSLFFECNN